ncbi:MAG: hypothetical protein HRT45_06355 [Bdellovibrionales bacterium]|nr:hypothetical protein [Bdellovibrionales bacterium]
MERRDQPNRRKIPRFTSKPVFENLKTLLKISRFLMGFLLSFAIYLFVILIFDFKGSLAQTVIGGGAMLFTAFRLNGLNDIIKLYLENESVTNLERVSNALVLMMLLFTFLIVLGTLTLVILFSDFFMKPITMLS